MALLTENKPLPFYLLLAEAPSLPALDFVQILSGAGIEELQARLDPILNRGRVNRLGELRGAGFPGEPLFPRGDDRSFLETLFLKLTLLSDLLQQCLGRNDQPPAGVKCDRVWVRIPPASGLLPLCWNFQIELLADIAPLPAAPRLEASADALTSLGLVWFQLLIRNGRVGDGKLLGAVNEYLAASADAADPGRALRELATPDNLFWHPGSIPLRGEWLPLWERACAPGYQLLGAAKRHDASCDGIVRSVEELRADLKAAMFAVGPRLEQPVQELRRPDDRELHGVLSRLIARNRQELRPIPAPASPVSAPDDFDETMETVILSPGPAFARNAAPPAEPQLDETYILPRSAPAQVHAAAPPANPGADGLLETVLLNPSRPTRQFLPTAAPERIQPDDQSPPAAEAPEETDELAETIVVMPQGGRIRPRFPRN